MRGFFGILLIFSLFEFSVHAQVNQVIALQNGNSTTYEDLSFLKQDLKDKQLVLLGEYTHMYGSIFQSKARLVEFLHQELGFTTFAIEAPMYDIYKLGQGPLNEQDFKNSIYSVWSSSKDFQRVVDYLVDNNLKVIGFDSQFLSSDPFLEDFLNYLDQNQIQLKVDPDDFALVLEGVLENFKLDQDDLSFKRVENQVKQIIKSLENKPYSEQNWYWIRFSKSLLSLIQDAYDYESYEATTDFVNSHYNNRDKQMADNLLEYVQKNPQEKIIVWADNIHVMYDTSQSSRQNTREFKSMGSHLKNALKDKVYSIATLHGNDSIYDKMEKSWFDTPIQAGSLEDTLLKYGPGEFYVSSQGDFLSQPMTTRLLDFVAFTTENLSSLHDGYLFLSNAKQSNQESFILSSNTADSSLKDSLKTNKENPMVQKGLDKAAFLASKEPYQATIIDKATNEPLQYAVISVIGQNLYQVSDQNGNFEIPFEALSKENQKIQVQLLGYHSLIMDNNQLSKQLFLEPNFDELPEIVVSISLSPAQVLKKAIDQRKNNNPLTGHNFTSYNKAMNQVDNSMVVDVEFINNEFAFGYDSYNGERQQVQEFKWNYVRPEEKDKFKAVLDFYILRMNGLRYSNILHKRKYKKFKLAFVEQQALEQQGLYAISFSVDRNKWNYTNKDYPTKYSGIIYINKQDFAVVKLIENWETTLSSQEWDKYFRYSTTQKQVEKTVIKQEQINTYSKIGPDSLYYWDSYGFRSIQKQYMEDGTYTENVSSIERSFYDLITKDVVELPFEWPGLRPIKNTAIDRVNYNPEFWDDYQTKSVLENIYL
ncbi:erythromycin esterase family protein [Myroides sp. LJL119]